MPFGTLVAGAVSIALAQARKKAHKGGLGAHASVAERLQRRVEMHVSIHQGLDLRTTVYLLGYFGVPAIEGSLIKDNVGILPFWFMVATAAVTVAGLTATAVSLFAVRWAAKPRTSEDILREERRDAQTGSEMKAAWELARCERVSRRKRPSSNISLILLCLDGALVAVSMPFFA